MTDRTLPLEGVHEKPATQLKLNAEANLADRANSRVIDSMHSTKTVPEVFGSVSLTDKAKASPVMLDVLRQNDSNRRDLVTADAPFHSKGGLAGGKYGHSDKNIPPGVTGVGGWGVIYPELGKTPDRSAKIQVADSTIYYHKKGGGWVVGQAPDQSKWWEGNYLANFRGNVSTHGDGKLLSDGSFQFSAPPEGKNDHFGPGRTTVRFDPALYDGVFTTMGVRSDKANSNLVMQIGADYYISHGVDPKTGVANPAVGGNNWARITDKWQKLYFTSLDEKTLLEDPPPGLGDGRGTKSSGASSPTEHPNTKPSGVGAATDTTSSAPAPGHRRYHREHQSSPLDLNRDGTINMTEMFYSLFASDVDRNGILSVNELSSFTNQLRSALSREAETERST